MAKAYLIIEHVIGGLHRVRCVSLDKKKAFENRDKLKARYTTNFQKKTNTLKIKEFIVDDLVDVGRVIDG